MNARQKLTPPRPGSPTRGNELGHIIDAVKRMFVQGKGIRLETMGDQMQISATGTAVAQGGGGSGVTVHTARAVSILPPASTVSRTDFARVTQNSPDPIGSMYIVSPDGQSWVCFTHFG